MVKKEEQAATISSGSGEGDSVLFAPWSRSTQEVLEVLASDSEHGLDASEVVRRRKEYGSNRLRERQTKVSGRFCVTS